MRRHRPRGSDRSTLPGTLLDPSGIRLPFLNCLTGALAERLHEIAAELAELAELAGLAELERAPRMERVFDTRCKPPFKSWPRRVAKTARLKWAPRMRVGWRTRNPGDKDDGWNAAGGGSIVVFGLGRRTVGARC